MMDGFIKWLELGMICFGLFCVGISVVLSCRFHMINQKLSKALSFQLFAEGIVGFVTVIFAITSWLNLYASLSPQFVLFLRLIIFTAASATSINLYIKVKQLENVSKSKNKEGE